MFEGRLGAICGGTDVEGECKKDGYTCDVSGKSFERFTKYLGLTVFAQPSEGGECIDAHVDLNEASMAGALQNNGVCPAVTGAVRKWQDIRFAHVANITAALKGCSEGVKQENCAKTLASSVVSTFLFDFFDSIEWAFGIKYVEMGVFTHDVSPVLEQGAKAADFFVDIPEGVKGFAAKLKINLEKPTKASVGVAKKLIKKWREVREFLKESLAPFLTPVLHKPMALVLEMFPEMYAENVQGALVHSGKLDEFQAFVKKQMDGMLTGIEKLCLVMGNVR